MAATTFNPKTAVFTPAETSTRGVERIKAMEANKHRAMPLPIEKIGEYFAPLMPGDICAIVAQSSNYKTGIMKMWETFLAGYLKENGRDEVIIRVDAENSVEGLAIQDIAMLSNHTVADLSRGNVRDWKQVIEAASSISDIAVYRIATSLGSDMATDLYLSNIYRAINYMVKGELTGQPLKPACIFIDYLQALPIDTEVATAEIANQRRLQVRQDVYRIRQMSTHLDCPIVVGVQAKQSLGGHTGSNMLVPGMYDGEESSSIAQRFDRVIGLWMPKTTHTVGDSLTHKGTINFEVTEDLIWIKVNKQRGGLPAGRSWQCKIDYDTNTIKPI